MSPSRERGLSGSIHLTEESFEDGEVVDRIMGAVPRAALRSVLNARV